jgi:hypothetical protein
MRWLFDRCAERWALESPRKHAWRGLSVFGIDGTSLRVPDSAANRAHSGGQSTSKEKGQSGYPLARLATIMALRSHLLLGARFGPHGTGETVLAKSCGRWFPTILSASSTAASFARRHYSPIQ